MSILAIIFAAICVAILGFLAIAPVILERRDFERTFEEEAREAHMRERE